MRILEITRSGFFKALQPGGVDWFRWGDPLTADEPYCPDPIPSFRTILQRLRKQAYDLVVLPAIHPEHKYDEPWTKIIAKSALRSLALLPYSAALLTRALGSTRHIIVDIGDDRRLCRTTMRLFPDHAMYFKRELSFADAASEGGGIRGFPLFVPNERRMPEPREKDIDVFFAGSMCNDIRRAGVLGLRELTRRGFRIVVCEAPLPYPEFLDALARSWLVLSPEGYGWDCYRHYEACLAGSVPVINWPDYRRPLFLENGVHCVYYDAAANSLADLLAELLAQKDRLLRMGSAARQHVLANHTRSAVARYMLREIGGNPQDRSDTYPRDEQYGRERITAISGAARLLE